tara:strand:- start:7651 stop:8670 length:1020 start_codon:yes stop_codon:yes gene_type:complete
VSRQKSLIKYLAIRLALAPVMIWLISTMVFLLLRIAPGDPVDAILGNRANEAAREVLRVRLGLDQPVIKQYLFFLKDLLHGDLGEALTTQEPVKDIISKALPATIELGICALLIASLIGISIGLIGTENRENKTDLFTRLYGISSYAIPPFWAAMIVQLIFAVLLGWLPVGGRFPPSLDEPQGTGFLLLDSILNGDLISFQGSLRHLLLPAFTLGILLSGIFSRSIRLSLEQNLQSNYIEAAKTRGLNKSRIILKHALPNALLPVLTITGLTISSLIGGALLIEVTFSWPGIAMGLQEAIKQRDYPVVQGIIVSIASLMIIVSITVDILIAAIDPRIKY